MTYDKRSFHKKVLQIKQGFLEICKILETGKK